MDLISRATSGTTACTRLAFNLYNSFTGLEEDEASKYSVIDIMAYAGGNLNKEAFLEGVKIRFDMIKDKETSFFEPEESIEDVLKRMGFNKAD